MNNKIGVIQGRLVPKYQGRYQAFPIGMWQDEFKVAQEYGLDLIEFILDFNDAEDNPLLKLGGIEDIVKVSQDTGVLVKSICADYFMEAPLHSSDDKKREEIMPINKSINLEELKESIKYFFEKTGTRITYEYILFKDINDSLDDAHELVKFCKSTPCKVNLIEYNSVDNIPFQKASNNKTEKFINFLNEKNVIVNLRRSKGKDINAACGQLVNKLK